MTPTMNVFLLHLCASFLIALPLCAGTPPNDFNARFDTVTARRHLDILASDDMRGRNTPSPELERAADYIAGQFRSFGLEPLNGSYFHGYHLERMHLAEPTTLTILKGRDTVHMALKADFIPFEMNGAGNADLRNKRVVFVGFGITVPEQQYDDYAGIDAHDAVVLVMRGEPLSMRQHGSMTEKIRNARAHGAVAILAVDVLRGKSLTVSGYPWPMLYPNLPKDAVPLTWTKPDVKLLPVFHIGEAVLNALVDSIGTLHARRVLIDSLCAPQSMELPGVRISCKVTFVRDSVPVRNVVGLLKGAVHPDEYVVMGAHYDHIGTGRPNDQGDSIFNGADDNASGTAGLLMNAEAFAKGTTRPDRSILFIAFSAEERGLLGSKAYAATPLLPLANCVGMLNMDMIGRCENAKLSIGGHLRCPDLIAINEEENRAVDRPFTLAYDIEAYFFRSDQASFAMKRIPVLFYFTGEHADYHRQGDEIAKINFTDLVRISSLAGRVAWRVAGSLRSTYLPAGWED